MRGRRMGRAQVLTAVAAALATTAAALGQPADGHVDAPAPATASDVRAAIVAYAARQRAQIRQASGSAAKTEQAGRPEVWNPLRGDGTATWPESSATDPDDGAPTASLGTAGWYPTFAMMPQDTQPSSASAPTDDEDSNPDPSKQSVSAITQKLANPVGDLWVLTSQFNITQLAGGPLKGSEWQTNWNIQPVLPLHLSKEWNLIIRPVIPLYFGSPYPEVRGLRKAAAADLAGFLGGNPLRTLRRLADRRLGGPGRFVQVNYLTGIGDIELPLLLSPRQPPKVGEGEFIWGVGPTFIFPTAGPGGLGQGQFQAGPAVVALYMDKKWVLGAFAQQWWGFGGNENKPAANHMSVQYFIQYQFAPGWQVGLGSPIVTADWTRGCDTGFTFPIGVNLNHIFKIGRLPVKLGIEYDYAVVHPSDDVIGPRSIFRITLSPVLPSLIPGDIFPN